MVIKNKILLGTVLLAVTLMYSASVFAGSSKFLAIQAAKTAAERAIVETVNGLKIRSNTSIEELVTQSDVIDAKTSARVIGIQFDEVVYDKNLKIARAVAKLKVNKVVNIIGKELDHGDKEIKRVGFGTSDPSRADTIKAMRAAELDAYRQLAKTIVGIELQSSSRVEDFILKSDKIKTNLLAAIWGARIDSYSWDKDGDASVILSLKVSEVEDILGQKFEYENGDIIRVEGHGAAVDDTASSMHGSSLNYREGSLGIPMINSGDKQSSGSINMMDGGAAHR